ncbi:MAG TPA: uroporphyrinogen-III synthase [Afifellaceae bacterium]|nr:uroporphyrinogen-III synthase [Afifellaceae bacterium]
MRLIVTRPDPDGERTALALEKLGHEAILSPALEIRYLVDAAIRTGKPQAILVTSVNAVRALERHVRWGALKSCPVLAVGDRTAVEAKRAGFASSTSAGGALKDLLAVVKRSCTPAGGPLLYAAGADRAGHPADELGRDGYAVETVVVYRAEKAPDLADAAHRALDRNEVDGVLLYSARTAEAFAEQLDRAGLLPLDDRVVRFCLSEAIAEAAQRLGEGPTKVAETPDQLALFAPTGSPNCWATGFIPPARLIR